MSTTFVNPATLSFSSPSPAPSTPSYDDSNNFEAGPSRKRPRTTGTTSEERKEARAHRNRIAAQNSRDRRKAQFTYLERRVAELEDENRRLRAGIFGSDSVVPGATVAPLSAQPQPQQQHHTVFTIPSIAEDERVRMERERERERENEELKERIRTLEKGWDAVVKALAAQGLPTGLSAATTTTAQPAPAPVQPTITTPIKPAHTAFPSPAPSHASLDFDMTSSPITPPASALFNPAPITLSTPPAVVQPTTTTQPTSTSSVDTARHLARATSSVGVVPGVRQEDDVEALFREMLASPRAQSKDLPSAQVEFEGSNVGGQSVELGKRKREDEVKETETMKKEEESAITVAPVDDTKTSVVDWANEIEMQRLLDSMIESNVAANEAAAFGIDLGMGMGLDVGFDMNEFLVDPETTSSGATAATTGTSPAATSGNATNAPFGMMGMSGIMDFGGVGVF
ncbi:hypothetical protein CVT24_007044 [Panaeolus cyanescens]|uniref:X-box-binding protein 1 n=1 Tax=Panaeolus cyanescens TaxID=181874 RepID=A0A409VJQ2_9AGAR|nr:hypothetical protein CVT24_007044 [Panaeolus cyanescens]